MESVDIERARTIVDRSQLKRLGFLGTILDIIDAPEPVLAALVDVAKVHLIPVAKGDVNPQEVESFQSITKYVAADGSYEIRRSQYSNDMAVRFMQLKVALFLGHSSSDDRKQALIERISERRVEMAANQERMKRLYQEQEKVRNRQVQLHKERESINEQRHALLAAVNEWKKKCQTLELKKSNVHRLTESNSQNDANKEEELKGELRNLFKQHAKLTIEGVKLSEEYCTLVMTMATENLSIVQVQSEVDRISEEVRTSEAQHEELRRTLSEAEASATELKQRCKDIAATADPNPPDEETAAVLAELPEGIEDLDRMLAVERARMEMADGSSIGNSTIREYEQRKRSITDLGQSLEKLERDQDGLRGQMDRLSAEWIPAVESMISLINERFSDFFALMGCAGQVRFAPKDRDYSDYALEILVKFRDIDSLQVLSAQRQSGGEKSVSTIIYLLALQELAKSPFRVVDEINQGMDAINERHVHALIVETATRAARSQYMMDIC
jgi:chromosome segregation ATPase